MADPVKKVLVKVKKRLNETATKKDSLDTHNSSQERNEFYRKSGYTEETPKKFDKSKLNQSDVDESAFKSINYKKDKNITTNVIRNGSEKKEILTTGDYVKKIDKHKYTQRDNITYDVNMDAPPGLKDSRIQPTETITFKKGSDIANIDQYQKPLENKKKVMVKVKKKQATKAPIQSTQIERPEILKKGSYLASN